MKTQAYIGRQTVLSLPNWHKNKCYFACEQKAPKVAYKIMMRHV